jgi:hypothetical protein
MIFQDCGHQIIVYGNRMLNKQYLIWDGEAQNVVHKPLKTDSC